MKSANKANLSFVNSKSFSAVFSHFKVKSKLNFLFSTSYLYISAP